METAADTLRKILAQAEEQTGIEVPAAWRAPEVKAAYDVVIETLDKIPLTPEERKAVGLLVAMTAVLEPT